MIRQLLCIGIIFCLSAFAQESVRDGRIAIPSYENLNAILWVQTSVEYRAATEQTYRLAKDWLIRAKRDKGWTAALEQAGNFRKLPPGIILDLDETVLDNSAFDAHLTAEHGRFSSEEWNTWVSERRAGLVPGAKDFLLFAAKQKIVPLYITNRECDSSKSDDPTVQLLRSLELPLGPGAEQLYCAQKGDSDKGPRRKICAAKYRILLQFGDQLGDFLSIPNEPNADVRKKLEERGSLFAAHEDWWGQKWFQLPNPMYGSWEDAIGYTVEKKLPLLRQ